MACFWENVITFNSWHQENLVKIIVEKLFGTLAGKKIIILGFAFKSNTNDTRESPAIYIVNQLIKEGANIFIHDPKVNKQQIEKDLKNFSFKNDHEKFSSSIGSWEFCSDIENTFNDAHAVLILTEWKEYINFQWDEISQKILNTAWIFDARGILKKDTFKNLNVNLWQIGNS